MKSLLYTSDSRGKANYDWLKTNYSFSFAEYYDANRMGFGALRVLNDDSITGGRGFDAHPHQNMEIITIPLSGGLEHKDNMGNIAISKPGDIQVMSAGSGVFHSEFNAHTDETVTLLQIWVIPNKMNIVPRYEQRYFDIYGAPNVLHQIISPIEMHEEGIGIYQDAWFQRAYVEQNNQLKYSLKKSGNGIYLFVISGLIKVNNQELVIRDAIALWDIEEDILIEAIQDTEFILIEVPL
jgi:redox-sensitive bicupin YhaK (pirin superfamily)